IARVELWVPLWDGDVERLARAGARGQVHVVVDELPPAVDHGRQAPLVGRVVPGGVHDDVADEPRAGPGRAADDRVGDPVGVRRGTLAQEGDAGAATLGVSQVVAGAVVGPEQRTRSGPILEQFDGGTGGGCLLTLAAWHG